MEELPKEIRIAIIGNVDSGKTTTASILSNDILDNGKGLARAKILKHPHEKLSGRTSSVAQSVVKKNNKIFTFVDLAGHEKYLKTTVSGLNGYFIDYAIVVIGADRGIIGMTKEHLIIALSLNIPVIVLITKMDVAVESKLKKIQNRLSVIFSSKFAGNKKIIYGNTDNIDMIIQNYHNNNLQSVPIFKISNVTGENIENMKNFIFNLSSLKTIGDINNSNPKFIIDSRFKLTGIGLIISGVVKDGIFHKNQEYYFGPFNSEYRRVLIRSIHNNFKQNVDYLKTGCAGCFNIKFINSKQKVGFNSIRKGHILLSEPIVVHSFRATVEILHHPTTIKLKYEPNVHCGIVRQSAAIKSMDKPLIRTGDKASVVFEFKYKPEFVEVGNKITFREGRTKGVGIITEIIS